MEFQFLDNKLPLYMRVYNYYRDMIIKGALASGQKLPSIRRCSEELQISRTTVENAYMSLAAEGYIISRKNSGFYVSDLLILEKKERAVQEQRQIKQKVLYDFSSAGADMESFNFDLWRRYIKSALRQDERLLSYGEPQGEYEFREILSAYIAQKRNVVCSAGNIVVGAGVQSILHILCAVIGEKKTIKFCNPAFRQGKAVFRDHGWQISSNNADVIYVNPSSINEFGEIMSVEDRFSMIKSSFDSGSLIIEDDYGNEFSYFNKRTPSLQSLASGKNVVYIGTFSRLLLPSIRMSYMVLPDELMKRYLEISSDYNQTASKTEQIALCQFIRDGHLESQIRKQRKLYSVKARKLSETLKEIFGEKISIMPTDSDINIKARLNFDISPETVIRNSLQNGVSLNAFRDVSGKTNIILSCTAAKTDDFQKAAVLIQKSIQQYECTGS